jgi:CheY-like chemotaxis protein
VTQAGGHVGVYSELGRGTTFKVYLPWIGALPTAAAPAFGARGGSETLLLVEDDEVVLRVAVRTLVRAGYRVLTAGNGAEALALLDGHRDEVALVVTDVVMPVMTGSELARQLERTAPALPILFLSGYADEAIVRQGAIKPGSPFLQKPFTVDALVAKVRSVLDAARPTSHAG